MQVAWGRTQFATDLVPRPLGPAVAIGNFDGVHRGHQALVEAARDLARGAASPGAQAGILTFDPHPSQYFARSSSFPLLLSLPRRLELLGEAGADFALVEPFDAQLAAMTPEQFVAEVLVAGLGVAHVVIGYDFCFGKKRAGNAATLTALGAQHGFGVHVVPAIAVDGVAVSSTKVRELLGEARVTDAARLLGRPPEITGTVVRGAGRGRAFGIPTANLLPDVPLGLGTGIYAGQAVLLDRGDARFAAAISVGTNPTFAEPGVQGAAPVTIEAYLLDYPGEDLYGSKVRLFFVQHLREERRFDSVADLRAEIDRDIDRTRAVIAVTQGSGPLGSST
jgi:riboflavin kinase/FMN adenylyltransferase